VASAVNVSEGRDTTTIDRLCDACGELLLDVHRDADHNRSVLTLGGPPVELLGAVRALIEAAVTALDLKGHEGLHPRFGVVDVVPFAPVASSDLSDALELRDRVAIWAGAALGVPCFLYGPMPDGGTRSLPDVRKGAYTTLVPDTGPSQPHPSAGSMAVGARGPLVAYNLWVEGVSKVEARAVARQLRGEAIRVLGLVGGGVAQISCNLTDPDHLGPAEAYDAVAGALPPTGRIIRAELVGLVPTAVLERTPRERWAELDLSTDSGLETRLAQPSVRRLRS
jgi:glutamate formiminotransferase / 5-formyltetrahydrofolate cyclo-ligase